VIKGKDVVLGYDSEILNEKFDFTIYRGEKVAIIGKNGSGKTTTAAKLGKQFQDARKKVLFVAADTFRAAAVDQLEVWENVLIFLCFPVRQMPIQVP